MPIKLGTLSLVPRHHADGGYFEYHVWNVNAAEHRMALRADRGLLKHLDAAARASFIVCVLSAVAWPVDTGAQRSLLQVGTST